MSRSALRLLTLLLPLVGLAGTWIYTHYRAQQGVEWDVPVRGYDPRDLLRGHYIQYEYDWPGLRADEAAELCFEGAPPALASVRVPAPGELGTASCSDFARSEEAGGIWFGGLWRGRLYIPQARAAAMESKFADPKLQAAVRIRLRPDGHITPLRMTFRPRAAVP